MELFGTDGVATLWVNAYATNPDGSVAALGEDNPADGSNGTINDETNTPIRRSTESQVVHAMDWAAEMHPLNRL